MRRRPRRSPCWCLALALATVLAGGCDPSGSQGPADSDRAPGPDGEAGGASAAGDGGAPAEPDGRPPPLHPAAVMGAWCKGRAAAEPPRAVAGWFPYGVLEDAARTGSFEPAARDWQSHGLDAVLFINGRVSRDTASLTVADRLGLGVVFSPAQELAAWFRDDAAPTLDGARRTAAAVLGALRGHVSLRGYNLLNDATDAQADRVELLARAFGELDPDRPAVPVVLDGQATVLERARPRIAVTYVFPARAVRPPCNFASPRPGAHGYARELRQALRGRGPNVPAWLVLQSHGTTSLPNPALAPTIMRQPSVEEMRLQNFVAIGEGAKGIFWFTWSAWDFWLGLKDRPAHYAEVTDLARRMARLKEPLLGMEKGEDRFAATAEADLAPPFRPYVSTLATREGRLHVVVANHACTPQRIAVAAAGGIQGRLRDLETGAMHELGAPIELRGGDGRLLELVEASAPPPPLPPPPAPVVLPNPSFDLAAGSAPAMWGGQASATWDGRMARSGAGSLRLAGAATATLAAPLTLKPDTRYVLSAWVRTMNVTGVGVGVQYAQVAPARELVPSPRVRGTSVGWVQVRRSFYTAPDHAGGRLEIAWELARGDLAWVDDLSLVEEPSACE